MHVHVVGDDPRLVRLVASALRRAGHVVQIGADLGVEGSTLLLIARRTGAAVARPPAPGNDQPAGPAPTDNLGIALDVETRTVVWAGETVQLTRTEFRLLQLLASAQGRVVPYARLVEYTWGPSGGTGSALLKTYISRLRTKLGPRRAGWPVIKAVQGVGYRLVR